MGQEKALPWKNWEVVKLIGKGTYGDVYEIRKGFHWHRIYRKRRRILLQRLILWNL